MSIGWTESWIFRLLINLLGYATVAVPGALLIRYFKDRKILDAPNNCVLKYINLFVHGEEDTRLPEIVGNVHSVKPKPSTTQKALTILFCFAGLQVSYLTWGLLQEKIMTQDYQNSSGEISKFTDSQFLVFVNRVLAFIFAGTYVSISKQPKHVAPIYKYSYCSFSNIMSSWLQYEALKYVSFPTQVLAKASKIIPVMIMGLHHHSHFSCHCPQRNMECFANTELADMHLIPGLAEGNARATEKLKRERNPQRDAPD
ncbi:adenosine 3'-phospho 5'-phosphosulfate transporter 1 [Trichonephila clavipes]|nr:adenosine 3'-phospho 5'-phosphosulfate transporter 1 [Trichonephila clavipes]